MKKIICAVSTVALMFISSCQKEFVKSQAGTEGGLIVSATLEQPGDDSKTYLDGSKVKWSANDAIKVFDNSGRGAKLVARESGKVTVNFVEPSPAVRDADFDESNIGVVFYPYNENVSCSGTTVTFTMPEVQTYAANTFANGANAMVGTVSGSGVSFKNVCGALKLDLKTTTGTAAKVGKIVVTDPVNNLWGDFTVEPGNAPEATYSANGGKSVTLVCPEGVEINDATNTFFYISLPVGALSNGFKAEVYSTNGHLITTLSSSKISTVDEDYNKIIRSEVRAMPEREMKWLPSAYSEIISLEGTGQQYIDTKYEFSTEQIEYRVKYEMTQMTKRSHIVGGNSTGMSGASANAPYLCGIWHAENNRIEFYAPSGCVSTFTQTAQTGIEYEVVFGANNNTGAAYLELNGERKEASGTSKGSVIGKHTPYLFHCNKDNGYNMATLKMSYFEIKDGGTSVRYFIPCISNATVVNSNGQEKPAGIAGMYDVVNDVFYTSETYIEFNCIGSPTTLSEDDITKISYIEGTGTQYVDTKYLISSEKIRYKAKFETVNSIVAESHIVGANTYPNGDGSLHTQPYAANVFFPGNGSLQFYHTNSCFDNFNQTASVNSVYEFDYVLDNTAEIADLTINGETLPQQTYDNKGYSIQVPNSVYLFDVNVRAHNRVAKGRMYYFTMYDNGTLVRDMVPCTVNAAVINAYGRSSVAGTAGMYDKVTKYFYPSLSVDDFVAGPEITE